MSLLAFEPPEVPDFELLRQIGRGGFGEVWLARNLATGHLRAVKLIPLQAGGNAGPAGREITSLTRLEANVRQKHPNLLDIQHVGRTVQHLYYVMEPADDISGSRPDVAESYRPATLENLLASGPLTADECLRLTGELLAGLGALHKAGMVHRDVKPANCLFVGGTLKLADFGLLTESHGAVSRIGTETYMPPDGRMDTRADVYAAGLVIYEMLTGLPARRFPTLAGRADAIRCDHDLAALNCLALTACQREPEHRPADATAMAELFDKLIHHGAGSWRQRPIVRLAVVCTVLLALAVALGSIVDRALSRRNATPGAAMAGSEPKEVTISFITDPFEAEIVVDGQILRAPDGSAYRTPVTVPNLPWGEHEVVFRRPGALDLPAGRIDFTTTGEVEAKWEVGN
ncbi:MAG: serine/threonine-protein kinase [Thermoguttaceae bacterium]